jgi:hypothetical protein
MGVNQAGGLESAERGFNSNSVYAYRARQFACARQTIAGAKSALGDERAHGFFDLHIERHML